MGLGTDYPVADFINHLADEHADNIDPKDVEMYMRVVKKLER